MPEKRDFSGGYSDLPIELHDESQLLEACNVYWAQRLKKWGGEVLIETTPATPMTDCFHVHPYVRVLDGQAFTFFLRFVTDHAELWAMNHTDNTVAQVGADFWDGEAITAGTKAWSTQVEQGIVFGAAGAWPMVITECPPNDDDCTEGAFALKTLDSFDVRERSTFDTTTGFAKHVGRPQDDDNLSTVFIKPLGPTDEYGIFGDEVLEDFATYRNNILWVTSLLTFNRITIEGSNLPTTCRLYLVNDEGEHHFIGTFSTPVIEWDWKAEYAKFNKNVENDFGAGMEGQSNYRAFLWFDGPDPIPLPGAPTNLIASSAGRITWNLVTDATSYETRHKVASANDSTYSAWAETTNTYVTPSGIVNGTEYRIQIRSKNDLGVTVTPAELDFTPSTIITAPGTPMVRFDGYDIIVERGSGDTPTSYLIQYREGSTGGYFSELIVGTESATFTTTINGPLQATAQAINSAGDSAFSAVVERVRRPSYSNIIPGDGFVIIGVNPVAGAITYDMQRAHAGTTNFTTIITGSVSSSLVDNAFVSGGWAYRVRAVGSTGPGPWSVAIAPL